MTNHSRPSRLAIVVAFVGITITLDVCRAAEISCSNRWGLTASTRANLNEQYPSGRRPTPDTCQSILVVGEIQNGDYEKFAKIVTDNHPFLSEVYLWSPGGSVEEALKIGALVKKDLLTTRAPFSGFAGSANQGSFPIFQWGEGGSSYYLACKGSDCYCASSCFLIWAGGVSREGDLIGIHRPSIKSTKFENLPPTQASSLYRQLLREIGSYLQDMEVPHRYIDAMTDTASNESRWMTEKEAQLMHEVPSLTEWKTASCGHFTKNESEELTRLMNIRRTVDDEMRYKALIKKSSAIGTCGNNKMTKARDAISNVLK